MPREGYVSVSLPADVVELARRIAPHLKARPEDGRRRRSRGRPTAAWAIETCLRDLRDRLARRGGPQVPLELYAETP